MKDHSYINATGTSGVSTIDGVLEIQPLASCVVYTPDSTSDTSTAMYYLETL